MDYKRSKAVIFLAVAAMCWANFLAQGQTFIATNIGNPAITGSVTPTEGGYNVISAGTNIFGAADQFFFNYQALDGDFDVKIRVEALTASETWAKAGLMARESLDGGARHASAFATPSVSGTFFSYRSATNAGTTNIGSFPITYPNTWLRLKRVGAAFTGYAGMDGQNWTQLGTITLATPASTFYVGLAATGASATQTASAQFRQFGDASGGSVGTVEVPFEPLGASSRKTGLVISEIMYHPRELPGGQSLEFIEIYNSNPFWEDIGDYRISGAVNYKFAKGTVIQGGSYLVVARDPAFLQTYYGITGVFGPWDGASTNSLPGGEGRVRLRSEADAVLLEVNYQGTPPWPTAADGAGHSLVLTRASYGEGDVRAWGASAFIDGSPGRAESFASDPLNSVVINEFLAHTDDPVEDFIELYNHSNQAVDLSGAYLSDEASTNKYQIPNGTSISARGFVYFTQSTLGFSLRGAGEKIFLVNPAKTRVIDAVDFGPQENGVSTGRYPNGSSSWYRMAATTPGQANSGIRQDPIVINEIMYNPITGDNDDEYIELYNRGNGPVDVGGWQFVEGINFSIPPNTIVASNGYLVIAKNAARLIANYPNLNTANTLGDYEGTLANGGERVALGMPDFEVSTNAGVLVTNAHYIVVSEVTYGNDGLWGHWSDGGGSSLELKDPRSDIRQPANWADSDESTKGLWTNIEVTGTLGETLGSPINDSLLIFLLGIGECLVDEVEVRNVTGGAPGPNLLRNPGFEAQANVIGGTTNWFPQGSHDHSRRSSDAYAEAAALHLRAASRGDNGANRLRSDVFTASLTGPVLIRAKAKWLRGWPELLLRIHGGSLEVGGRLAIRPDLGSPGAPNGKAVPNAGPAVYDVIHTPVLPQANESVVITAKVSDPDQAASVQVKYRLETSTTTNTSYTSVPMVDDGTGGDRIAGDGVYSGTIPGQAAGTRMGFYVEATDALGASNTFPQELFPTAPDNRVFPLDAFNREAIVRWGDFLMPGAFGNYRLWLNGTNTWRWNTRRPVLNNSVLDGTFVYNNYRVIYNMRPSYAGSPWHRGQMDQGPDGSERVDFDIEFPGDNKFLGAGDAVWNNPGNPEDRNFTLPTIGTATDLSCQSEQTSYIMFKEIGVQYNYRRYVHVFVNGTQRSLNGARAGTWIMEDSQQPNADVIREWSSDDTDGELYKIEDWFEFPVNGDDFTANNDADLMRRTIVTNGVSTLHSGAYRFMWRKRTLSAGESANDYGSFFALINAVSPTSTNDAPINVGAISQLMDYEQWMRIFAVQHTIGNWDSYGYDRGKNAYTYKGANGLFQQWTWDIDFTMNIGGNGPQTDIFGSTDSRIQRMWRTGEILRAYWHAYWDIINGPLNNSFVDPIIDAKAAALRDNNINFDPNQVTTIKNFVRDRRIYLAARLANLTNAPYTVSQTLTTNGNVLTISGTAGLLVHHFEVNGVFYRANWPLGGGGNDVNSPTNWSLSIPLEVGTNVLNVQAFDRLGQPIAGTERTLTINFDASAVSPADNIVITEIMYNPAADGTGYVELYNRSTNTTFDLSGWRMNGLGFTFPDGTLMAPNTYIVLASSLRRFGSTFIVPGQIFEFDGQLDNGGETLTLIKPGVGSGPDLIVDQVRYDDDAPWPAAADGGSASLQLIDVSQDNSRVSNWGAGATWRNLTRTGNILSATNLLIWLTTAGDVYIDDVSLSLTEDGTNILANGDFESDLAASWLVPANMASSEITTSISRSGSRSLHLVSSSGTVGGSLTTTLQQRFPGRIVTNGTYTLSLWWYGSSNGYTLSMRTLPGANLLATVNTDVILATPGAANTLAAPTPPYDPLWLNEVQSVNQTGVQDNMGDRDPWIELYNGGTNVLNLEGYYLATSFSNLTQWPFPPGSSIQPGEYKLIWADGETSESTPAALHTSFGISAAAGSIVLARTAAGRVEIADYLNYTGQQVARSFGDVPDGQPFRQQVFFLPTPGASNLGHDVNVFINEWLADNVSTLADPADGQFEDWFELHNPGTEDIDLGGYFLTDNVDQPRQFTIPSGTVIRAGGFLLVWADGEPGQNNNSTNLHTNFRLAAGGEAIALFAPNGDLVDSVTFGPQAADISEGRFPDSGPEPFYAMSTPTPARANILDTGGENQAPTIDPIGDKYLILGQTLNFPVTASDPDVGQTLSYSLPQSPLNATINAAGVFNWTPSAGQAPSVNNVMVQVADNGTPSLSANRNFTIYVSLPPQVSIRTTPGGTGISLGFPAVAGKHYQVKFKDDLNDATWQNLGDPQEASGSSLQVNDLIGSRPHRFYKIQVLD